MELYQLAEVIDNPTRTTEFSTSLVDECVSSTPEKIVFSDVIDTGESDHSLIFVFTNINVSSKTNSIKEILFRE